MPVRLDITVVAGGIVHEPLELEVETAFTHVADHDIGFSVQLMVEPDARDAVHFRV